MHYGPYSEHPDLPLWRIAVLPDLSVGAWVVSRRANSGASGWVPRTEVAGIAVAVGGPLLVTATHGDTPGGSGQQRRMTG
jgi:hypothetical protein